MTPCIVLMRIIVALTVERGSGSAQTPLPVVRRATHIGRRSARQARRYGGMLWSPWRGAIEK